MTIDNPSPLIQLTNVVKYFDKFVALNNISLSVREGEFLALLGPSGCGKTTLLRTIAGFNTPSSGDILIEGKSVKADPPNRRPVNTVFQNYALFPHMTVTQNVSFGPKRQQGDKSELADRVQHSLALVGMEDFAHRYPSELSGGQQQRVALARAIINQPKVLLLDEPLAALDLKLRKRMQIELKRLQEKLNITFIIVTHDQEEALVMADRIVVMSEGKIEQCGTGEHIYAHPESRYVAGFIGEANLIECRHDASGQLMTAPNGFKLPYTVECGISPQPTLMIRPERIHIGGIQQDSADYVCMSGQVRDIVYTGASRRIYVANCAGDEIVIAQPDGMQADPICLGKTIQFHWHKDDAKVLTK